MRAVLIPKHGGPEVLKVEEVPIPQPGTNEVLVQIHAAGVNPVDTYIRDGLFGNFTKLPYIPGMDGAGIVEAVGGGVTRFKKGDRVFVYTVGQGVYAEYCVCPQHCCFPLPSNVTFSQGAAIGVPYFTAYNALFLVNRNKHAKTVLIHGASGGVGVAAVQLAKQAGMTIYGTAGTEEGLKLVKDAGADHVFNHRESGYETKIKKLQAPDVILEMVANVNLPKDVDLINVKGTIAVIGCHGSVTIEPGHLMGKGAAIVGITVLQMNEHELAEAGATIVKGLESGVLAPIIDKEYPLDKAPDAQKDVMKDHGAKGKLVILTDK